MFELTNEQRKCFGLQPVCPDWVRMELKPSRYDHHITVTYLHGNELKKYIESGENVYLEAEICEHVSDDLKYLLPKTAKGKPAPLTAASLQKRSRLGMSLVYTRNGNLSNITLFSHSSEKDYYISSYEPINTDGIEDFARWVQNWCDETTPEDLADIERFAALPRQHVKFKEGDVFRFKLNHRLYGYGRILLDYAAMRKEKIPFWDCFMGKPLVCSAYHIATERHDVTVDELTQLGSLPSVHMVDNNLFYGTYEIIGNIPIGEHEDYPIIYAGNNNYARLQCGKLYAVIENSPVLFQNHNFFNSSHGFNLQFELPILQKCIEAGSNEPYWAQNTHKTLCDLRNPKFCSELEEICRQFDISPDKLI